MVLTWCTLWKKNHNDCDFLRKSPGVLRGGRDKITVNEHGYCLKYFVDKVKITVPAAASTVQALCLQLEDLTQTKSDGRRRARDRQTDRDC